MRFKHREIRSLTAHIMLIRHLLQCLPALTSSPHLTVLQLHWMLSILRLIKLALLWTLASTSTSVWKASSSQISPFGSFLAAQISPLQRWPYLKELAQPVLLLPNLLFCFLLNIDQFWIQLGQLFFTYFLNWTMLGLGFSGGTSGKEPSCQCKRHKRHECDPCIGKIPWRRAWQPIPVFLPGESHGQRSPACYSPKDLKESDMTEAT